MRLYSWLNMLRTCSCSHQFAICHYSRAHNILLILTTSQVNILTYQKATIQPIWRRNKSHWIIQCVRWYTICDPEKSCHSHAKDTFTSRNGCGIYVLLHNHVSDRLKCYCLKNPVMRWLTFTDKNLCFHKWRGWVIIWDSCNQLWGLSVSVTM